MLRAHYHLPVRIPKEELRQVILVKLSPDTIILGRLCRLGRSHDLRIPLHIKGETRSRKSGGRRTIATFATRVNIREPHVGRFIQSYDQRRIVSM